MPAAPNRPAKLKKRTARDCIFGILLRLRLDWGPFSFCPIPGLSLSVTQGRYGGPFVTLFRYGLTVSRS